jgi:hypothetical protein
MNTTKILGVFLIALGLCMMLYTGFDYVTSKKVVNIGTIEINHKENHFIQWSPYIGIIILVGGIIITISDKKARG